MPAQHVLIVGAGYTGQRLARLLAGDGHSVTSAQRRATGAGTIAVDLDDATSLDTLSARLKDTKALHVAYLVPPASNLADEHATDARLQSLLAQLPKDTARVVLASTTGVYGDCQGARVTEQSPLRPESRRARARAAAERTLRRWADETGVATVIMRIAGIYGPGRLPLDALRNATPMVVARESGPGNRIHVDDLVASFVAALFAASTPAVVNISDGNHLTSIEFATAVARSARLPAPAAVSLSTAKREFSAMRLSFILESRTIDNSVLTNELGVTLRYPDPCDGIRASLAESPETQS